MPRCCWMNEWMNYFFPFRCGSNSSNISSWDRLWLGTGHVELGFGMRMGMRMRMWMWLVDVRVRRRSLIVTINKLRKNQAATKRGSCWCCLLLLQLQLAAPRETSFPAIPLTILDELDGYFSYTMNLDKEIITNKK